MSAGLVRSIIEGNKFAQVCEGEQRRLPELQPPWTCGFTPAGMHV